MKEAAGEANMTVITIVLIAIVLAVGTIVVRSMMSSTRASSCCQSLGGKLTGTTCTYKDASNNNATTTMNDTNIKKLCPENN